MGPQRRLTAVVDGNVSGVVLHKWWCVAVVGPCSGFGGGAEGDAEEVYGVALKAELDVVVDGGGDTGGRGGDAPEGSWR